MLTTSGFHDLLVTDPVANTVQVLLSNGDDTFKEATGSPITVGQEPSSIVVGDFNADGNQDFAVTNFKDNTFSVFLGNGDGTFKQATGSPFPLPTTATGPIAMTSSDFNSDGNLDLAIVNQTTNNVAVLLGNGNATFSLATGSPFAVGKSPVAIASADLNADSHPDLAVVNQTDNTVSVLLGNGDGTFTSALNSPLATGQAPTAVAIADFNGDGVPDIAVTDPQTDSVSVYLGLGQGLFAPAFELPVGHESHGHSGCQPQRRHLARCGDYGRSLRHRGPGDRNPQPSELVFKSVGVNRAARRIQARNMKISALR